MQAEPYGSWNNFYFFSFKFKLINMEPDNMNSGLFDLDHDVYNMDDYEDLDEENLLNTPKQQSEYQLDDPLNSPATCNEDILKYQD